MVNLMARMFNWEASRAKYKAREIVEQLDLNEGDVVADIGSGGGFFTYLFSERVGESGKVYAVDTSRSNLAYIEARVAEKGLQNVKAVPTDGYELDLPEGAIDKVFTRNVYHHLKEPASYFSGIKKYLKPDGKVVIIDHREKTKGGFVGLFKHYTPEEDIVSAMAKSGFKLSESSDFLPAQSFLVFEMSGGT
jgi:ubiquinone/menaquinone biosynthesis C-methylase UbiE